VGGSFALPSISNNGIDGTWTPAFNNTQTTTYTFTPTIGQCANTTTLTVEITTGITPTFPTFGPYCPNATPDVLPTISNNGITGTWNPSVINTTINGANNYTFTPSAGVCATPTTISISVNTPTPPIVPSQTICLGESTVLNATGNATYSWSGGVQNGVPFTPTATTTYTLTTTQNGCSTTSEVTIFVDQPSVVAVSADVTVGLPPLVVNFTNNSNNGSLFNWDFGNGTVIPVNTTAGQTMTYNEIGLYPVILTSVTGACENSDTVLIQVIPYAPAEVIIPNGFTPNGDLANDFFELQLKFVKSFSAVILNRWGNVVAEIDDVNPTWDGGDATDGVYFVLYKAIDFNDVVSEGQGFVHLIR
jgi:PKD repeat protein